jgi:hypothetical protein
MEQPIGRLKNYFVLKTLQQFSQSSAATSSSMGIDCNVTKRDVGKTMSRPFVDKGNSLLTHEVQTNTLNYPFVKSEGKPVGFRPNTNLRHEGVSSFVLSGNMDMP